MMLSIIVAASDNNVIGNKGQLPWTLAADFKRMKELTMGHPLIMGRKTHYSIGKPLPGRTNIVITRVWNMEIPGCEVADSLERAIEIARATKTDEAFIFGGGEIYKQAMQSADRIYLTRVHAEVEGDAFFPTIDPKQWKEVACENHSADEDNQYPFSFIMYERSTRH